MSRPVLIGLAIALLAGPALAQGHDAHAAGHTMPVQPPPAAPADPHAGHQTAPTSADPHVGHVMPPAAALAPTATGAELEVGEATAPEPVGDHAAERFYSPADMAAARDVLRLEHGGALQSKAMLDMLEWRAGSPDAYAWDGAFRYGGDINRLMLKSEGEAAAGGLEHAEVQGLYSRAIGRYFDLQAGVRHDFGEGPDRTYGVVGVEGLAPYWFEVEAHAFLSAEGDLSARLGGAYDLRLTQRLVLEPSVELTLAATDDRAAGVGSGLSDAEAGLRLRYEIRREFAPYVGVNYERKFGRTADLARAEGHGTRDTRFVVGLRAWF